MQGMEGEGAESEAPPAATPRAAVRRPSAAGSPQAVPPPAAPAPAPDSLAALTPAPLAEKLRALFLTREALQALVRGGLRGEQLKGALVRFPTKGGGGEYNLCEVGAPSAPPAPQRCRRPTPSQMRALPRSRRQVHDLQTSNTDGTTKMVVKGPTLAQPATKHPGEVSGKTPASQLVESAVYPCDNTARSAPPGRSEGLVRSYALQS